MKLFEYGEKEIEYLKSRDFALAKYIEQTGFIAREIFSDIFDCLTYTVISQQISTKAARKIYSKLLDCVKEITPSAIFALPQTVLKDMGINGRKINCIKAVAQKFLSGTFSQNALSLMRDEDFISALTSVKGIGKWTAEMALIFALGRKDVFSLTDFGLKKGLSLLSGHWDITRQDMLKYKKLYSPYGSVASFYLWHLAAAKG